MINRETFRGTLIAAAGWIAGDLATRQIFAESQAVSAYASLVGWWFTAYLSARFAVPIRSALPLAVAGFALFLIAAIGGQDWFYKDAASLPLAAVFGLALVQALVVSSPILFDWSFRQAVRICSGKPKRP